jgi:hypothetical protein
MGVSELSGTSRRALFNKHFLSGREPFASQILGPASAHYAVGSFGLVMRHLPDGRRATGLPFDGQFPLGHEPFASQILGPASAHYAVGSLGLVTRHLPDGRRATGLPFNGQFPLGHEPLLRKFWVRPPLTTPLAVSVW